MNCQHQRIVTSKEEFRKACYLSCEDSVRMNESVNPTSLLTAIIAVLQNKRVDLPLICMIYKVYSFFENLK